MYRTPHRWPRLVGSTLLFLLAGLLAAPAIFAECLDYRLAPRIVGGFSTPNALDARGVTIAGDLCFVADLTAGLRIVNVADPEAPVHVSTLDIPGLTFSITVAGSYAFIASAPGGLFIVDISVPAAPAIVRTVPLPNALGVAINGTHAAVVGGESGFDLVSIVNPLTASVVGHLGVGTGMDVDVAGNIAYVTRGLAGFEVVDLTVPTAPQALVTIDTPGECVGIQVDGDRLYVADEALGLRIYDLSDPSQPVFLGGVDTPGSAVGIEIAGDLVLVADWNGGVQFVDASNPATPQLMAGVVPAGLVGHVAIDGANAYLATTGAGLVVLDVTNPSPINALGSLDTPGTSEDVLGFGQFAYVADGNNGRITKVNVLNPASPALQGTGQWGGYASECALAGTHMLVVDGGNLKIFDLALPGAPISVSAMSAVNIRHVAVASDDVAFITDGWLRGVDISDPVHPVVVSTWPQSAGPLDIDGTLAYVADQPIHTNGVLSIVNVINPLSPQFVGSTPLLERANGVEAQDGFVYIASGDAGLVVIDATPPGSPSIVGVLDTPGFATDVTVMEGVAYVADDHAGVQIIDVSDPGAPQLLGNVDTPGEAIGVRAHSGLVFVADGSKGMRVLLPQCNSATDAIVPGREPSASLDVVWPNPLRHESTIAFSVRQRSALRIDVFDVAGRRVRALAADERAPGNYRLQWRGDDDLGSRVSNGVYFVRLRCAAEISSRRVVVAR